MGANVLLDTVIVSGPKHDTVVLKAPLQWASDVQGDSNSEVPKAADWDVRIRSRTEPRPEQGLGQLVAKDPQSSSPVRLEVAQYHVNVTLKAPLAVVQIDQSFFNPFHRQEEGTFIFNLPEGASVSRFAMYVAPDQLIEGELIDRTRADQVYSTIVRAKRDPAILEQIGHNLFRMRIFPIFAQDTKRILLDYTVPLEADHGRYHFELPLMSDLKPIWDFELKGKICPPFIADSVRSPSHPKLVFNRNSEPDVTFSMAHIDYRPSPRFSVDYRAPAQTEPFVRTYLSNPNQQLFAATLPASANPFQQPHKTAPADVLVLIDTSESAIELNQARLITRTLMRNLRPEDRCQLGCADLHFRQITKEWLAPRSAGTLQALKQLDDVFALGGSKLDAAIVESLSLFADATPDRRQVIVYVGDGNVTIESPGSCWSEKRFRRNEAQRIEFHGVALSEDSGSRAWLKSGIERCQGRLFSMRAGNAGLQALFEWALGGIPATAKVVSCRCSNVENTNLFHDAYWPAGHEFHVYGSGPVRKSLQLQMTLSDETEQRFELALPDLSQDDVFVGRQWASRKLESLLDADDPKNPRNRSAIVSLCR